MDLFTEGRAHASAVAEASVFALSYAGRDGGRNWTHFSLRERFVFPGVYAGWVGGQVARRETGPAFAESSFRLRWQLRRTGRRAG